jgi:hypothetical protein
MAAIADQDKIYLVRIGQLRTQAEKLRKRAKDLRAVLRSEKGLRQRLEAYANYWQNIRPRWTWEEVWGGKMRVTSDAQNAVEITSSDEEMFAELDDENQDI